MRIHAISVNQLCSRDKDIYFQIFLCDQIFKQFIFTVLKQNMTMSQGKNNKIIAIRTIVLLLFNKVLFLKKSQ